MPNETFNVSMTHQVHGDRFTEIEIDEAMRKAAGGDDYVSLYPFIVAAARQKLAARFTAPFMSFNVGYMDLDSDKPAERYAIGARYPDGDPWDDWVHAHSPKEADFRARWHVAENYGGDPNDADEFTHIMSRVRLDDCQLEPFTKDELATLLREAVETWPQFDGDAGADAASGDGADLSVSGADMVEWFGAWRDRVKKQLGGEPVTALAKRPHDFSSAELAMVLAGLRLIQRTGVPDDLDDIATDGGTVTALTAEEIDAFCERINC